MINGTLPLLSSMIATEHHFLPAITIFLIATFGLYCHCFVIISIIRVLSQNSPYYMLVASQSFAEAIFCSLFAFYYSTMVAFNVTSMKQWSTIVGMFLICCLDVVNCSHLVIALNRLCAICVPTKYATYFCRTFTSVYIALIWVVSIVPHLYFDAYLGCSLRYSDSTWGFMFNHEGVCHFVLWTIDFSKQLTIVILIAILDTITISKVRLTSAKIKNGAAKQYIAKRNAEINFLKQAVCQFLLWIVEMFTYFYLAGLFSSVFVRWILTTLAWIIMHTGDGVLMVCLNKDVRHLFFHPSKLSVAPRNGKPSSRHVTVLSRVQNNTDPMG